ncbi:MAG: Gfo/Idh/MocA family oxidoreductase, partial [bacterium]|nr:Gfo/Idh/MocA family oxidoreductase [bacterium]
IGPLTTLNADFYLGAHFGGFRDEMEHVLILDMAIHSFDQARYISGSDPLTVYCYEWNPAGSWYRQGASAMAIFEMSNGMVFNYRGSWCAEGLNTPWECHWRAVGEHGSALWDGEDGIQAQSPAGQEGFIRPMQDVDIPASPALKRTGHGGVIAEFLDCVKNGGIPQTICTDNIKSLVMVHAAIESAATGKKVTIVC